MATRVSNYASNNGIIRTQLGRKCRFELYEPRGFSAKRPLPLKDAVKEYQNVQRAYTYKALNRLIQGSSADQTKKAMVDCYAAGLCPMLTVHDELCFNIKMKKKLKNKRIMSNRRTCQQLGRSWLSSYLVYLSHFFKHIHLTFFCRLFIFKTIISM